MVNIVSINLILFMSWQFTLASNCAPDLSSVGDSVITLSDELSNAYTAEERCEELGGYLVVTREADVNQTLMNAASQKYRTTITYPDTQRVWIYYSKNNTDIYKYSLSSNEASPWVSPQHLGHLWYLDLYTSPTFSTDSISIHFCNTGAGTGDKWTVNVDRTCANGWREDFVLYGLVSPKAGYKAIYAYNQGRTPWSMRLTDVKDDNYNGFNYLQGTFYAPGYKDIARVWIYYNKDQTNLYKYSLSSNEASPWVSPQHLGHLWYIDLYTSYLVTSIPIRFCEHISSTEKWNVGVNRSCHPDWSEQFVLYGLGSSEEGYKAIYAYDEGCCSWSMRLTDVRGDNYNGFNILRGTFYAPGNASTDTIEFGVSIESLPQYLNLDNLLRISLKIVDNSHIEGFSELKTTFQCFKGITRAWIYYNKDSDNLYKYSLSSNEASPWVSPQHLGHLWYIDLYNSLTTKTIPISFCKHVSSTEKWVVAINKSCHKDWPEQFVLYGLASSEPGYKAIYAYEEGCCSWSMRLTDVKGDNYNGFNNLKGTFYAIERGNDVFIGARFDVTSQQWKWSDGKNATEFTDVGHTTCQQKVWDYAVSQISNKACSGSETYYSCQVKVTFVAHQFECNSTLLEITWKILPLALNYGKNLTVSIQATNYTSVIRTSAINKPSAIIEGLEPRSKYNITIAAKFNCDDMPDFFSSQNVETGPGNPDDVTHGYVIKSQDECHINFANPLPKGSFNFTISVKNEVATQTEVVGQSEDCDQDICQIPIQTNEYTAGGKLTFSISASNCEGETSIKPVAGNCYIHNPTKPECSISPTTKDDSIVTFSEDFINVTNADIVCPPLGGTLAKIKETELNDEFYQSLSNQYTRDIQRIWIYRLKSDNQVYKYSFTNTTEDDWKAPTENDHLTYLELYNRKETKLDLISFCKAKDSVIDKWQVNTVNCRENAWQMQFSLYGTLTPKIGFKRIYMFVSTSTGSVKLKSSISNEPSFMFHGEFYVPDINVFVADTMSNNGECDVSTLYYGDNWALSKEPCAVTEAYYACQVEFKPRLEAVPCNSHELQVIWEDNMLKLQEKAKYMTITVVVNGDNIPEQQIEYSELSATIGDLTQRTPYTVTVTATIGGCFEHSLHSVLNQTTSYGLADPVTNARVEQLQSVCTIVIPQDPTGNVIIYQVAAISPQNTTYLKYPTVESEKEIRANISTKYHGNNEQVHFLIQASTCEGPNDWESVDGFCTSPKNQESGSSVGTIVGSTIGVLAAIALLGFGFIYFRRNKSGKSSKIQEQSELSPIGKEEVLIYQNVHTPSNHNLKDRLFNNYLTLSKNQFRDCKDQFKKIIETGRLSNLSNAVSQLDTHLSKNLSTNILTMDHARVKLTGNARSDYINASYVAGFKTKKKFISTLVPQSSTMQDFWEMIWQQKSATIVLISSRNDINNEEQYWPELGSNITFGKFRIKHVENSFGDIVVRKFELHTIEGKHMVTQFHYIGWPDQGTPITTTSFIRLRNMVEESHNLQTPITVQCSGNNELTGTYIAMDISFDEADIEGKVDLARTVLEMRKCRSEMVQTWQQYLFVNKLVLEHVYLPETDNIAEKLQHMTREQIYQMAKQEFEKLKQWRYGEKWIPGHPNLKTYDTNAVMIWSNKQQVDIKMNASYIEDLMFGGKFIASQCPLEDNEEEFWQMLLIEKVGLVVCLDENNFFKFKSENRKCGEVLLNVISTRQLDEKIIKIKVTSTITKESSELSVIEANTWKNKPPSAEDLINLISKMQKMKATKQEEYVVVCCKNGCDKTGTFIALVSILERLKSQNRVDVFRTIKDLRDMRPNMVDNLELYVYCYSVVLDYLSSQNTYDVDIPTTDDAYVEMKETSGEPIYNTISDA